MDAQHDLNQQLLALVDGELSPEEARALWARLADDPQLEARLTHLRQLKAACGRAMGEPAACPDALRAQIAGLLEQETPPPTRAGAPARPAVIASIGWRVPAAVAAALLVTALLLFVDVDVSLTPGTPGTLASPATPSTRGTPAIPAAQFASLTLPEERLARFNTRHRQCGKDLKAMYRVDAFPRDVAALPGVLSDYFHRPVAAPSGLDLSRIGYEYQVAGLCSVPGKGAVHVLYKALPETGRSDSLSLWIRPDDGSIQLDPDKLYLASHADGRRPLLIWRAGDLVYYLMGDHLREVEEAATALHPADTPTDGA